MTWWSLLRIRGSQGLPLLRMTAPALNFTDLLVNNTNTVQTVTYQFIPKILDPRTGLAYCEDGIDATITIWINPQPRIEVSASPIPSALMREPHLI
jgi:hypothetical protein